MSPSDDMKHAMLTVLLPAGLMGSLRAGMSASALQRKLTGSALSSTWMMHRCAPGMHGIDFN